MLGSAQSCGVVACLTFLSMSLHATADRENYAVIRNHFEFKDAQASSPVFNWNLAALPREEGGLHANGVCFTCSPGFPLIEDRQERLLVHYSDKQSLPLVHPADRYRLLPNSHHRARVLVRSCKRSVVWTSSTLRSRLHSSISITICSHLQCGTYHSYRYHRYPLINWKLRHHQLRYHLFFAKGYAL